MQATRSHRGLSTARAALSVTWLLARAPDGVRADEVAESLGKSVSTAYNLLASLCDEGRRGTVARGPVPPGPRLPRDRRRGVRPPRPVRRRRRPARAHAQARLSGGAARPPAAGRARARSAGHAEAARDEPRDPRQRARAGARQGRPRPRARRRARALPERRPQALHAGHDHRPRTRCAPSCAASAASASPTDREEIAPDFCCIAAPLLDEQRHFLGAVGISMSVRAFDAEREHLTETIRDVVGFQSCADRREVLEVGRTPVLASAPEHLAVKRRLRQRR